MTPRTLPSWLICLLALAIVEPVLAQGGEEEGLPLPNLHPAAQHADSHSTALGPAESRFVAGLAKQLGLTLVSARALPLTQGELDLMERRDPGSQRVVGRQLKVELQGLSLISLRAEEPGIAYRFAAAALASRHASWGALDAQPAPADADAWLGELVAARGAEALLAWGPALGALPQLQRVLSLAWSEEARQASLVLQGVFHRDYVAVLLSRPRGPVYQDIVRRLRQAREEDLEGETWVDPHHLRFHTGAGVCGEVLGDAGSGAYWVARDESQRALARDTHRLLGGAPLPAGPLGGPGMDSALPGH